MESVTQADQVKTVSVDTTENIRVVAEPSRQRYELFHGDTMIGMTVYGLPDSGHIDFVHTEVDPDYSGRGLAGVLAEFAIKDVQAQGKRVIPHCPYVRGWLRKHSEYDAIVDFPAE